MSFRLDDMIERIALNWNCMAKTIARKRISRVFFIWSNPHFPFNLFWHMHIDTTNQFLLSFLLLFLPQYVMPFSLPANCHTVLPLSTSNPISTHESISIISSLKALRDYNWNFLSKRFEWNSTICHKIRWYVWFSESSYIPYNACRQHEK